MAAKLVWIQDDGTLSCGHPREPATGQHGVTPREWFCNLCAATLTAQVEQERAALAKRLEPPGEAPD
jgi:hypothetical protein